MKRIVRPAFSLGIVFLGLAGSAARAAAQSSSYSLTDVLQLVQAGISTPRILKTIGSSCISFKVTPDVESVFRGASADAALVPGLKKLCYAGSDVAPAPVKKVKPPAPTRVVKHDTVTRTIVKHDTLVITRPVVTPPPVRASAVNVPVNIDFHSFKNAFIQSDTTCGRGYTEGVYYLRRPPGSSMVCGTFWQIVDTAATNVIEVSFGRSDLTPPYAYGIVFAMDDTSSYAFQIQVQDGAAHHRLARLVRSQWTFPTSDVVSPGIDVSGNNRVRVEVRDSGFQMYVNDRLMETYTPPVRARGGWFGVAQYGTAPGWILVNSIRFTQSTP